MKLRGLSTNEYVSDLMLVAESVEKLHLAVMHIARAASTESDKVRQAEGQNAQQALEEVKGCCDRLWQTVRIASAISQLDTTDRQRLFERLTPVGPTFDDDNDDDQDGNED